VSARSLGGAALLAAGVLLWTTGARAEDEPALTGATITGTQVFGENRHPFLGQYYDEPPNRFSNIRVELHLDFNWYNAVGAGARIEFPIAPYGILRGVDDEIALSVGAEFFYFYTPASQGLGVYPIVALQWNFYIDRISLFPELGVAFLFGPTRDAYWATFIAPFVGFGIRFHFTPRNALIARVSWPAGLQLGITF
jgi:hypothetical protein